jgi:hypothetical protein
MNLCAVIGDTSAASAAPQPREGGAEQASNWVFVASLAVMNEPRGMASRPIKPNLVTRR